MCNLRDVFKLLRVEIKKSGLSAQQQTHHEPDYIPKKSKYPCPHSVNSKKQYSDALCCWGQ